MDCNLKIQMVITILKRLGGGKIGNYYDDIVSNLGFLYDLKTIILSNSEHEQNNREMALEAMTTLSHRFAPAQMILLSTLTALKEKGETIPGKDIQELIDETKALIRKTSSDMLVVMRFKNCTRYKRYPPHKALHLLKRLQNGTQKKVITGYTIPEKAVYVVVGKSKSKPEIIPSEIELYFDKKLNGSEFPYASSNLIYKRDNWTCQYCGKKVNRETASIDHVYPQSRGGQTTWTNCVCACKQCNGKKRDRTPEEAGMPLLRIPQIPNFEEIY